MNVRSLIIILSTISLFRLLPPTDGQIIASAPLAWNFNTTTSIGPDGPWQAITIQVGWPMKNVSVFPGRNPSTLVILNVACYQKGAKCSNNGVGLYDRDSEPSTLVSAGDFSIYDVPGWNSDLTDPMQINGTLKTTLERITVVADDGSWQYLDNQTFLLRSIPSQSWGLHLGSAQHNVAGSLYFGGYDQARLLGIVGSFDDPAIPLTDISLNSTVTAFPSTGNLVDILNTSFASGYGISIVTEPALPYLYLPAQVCTALASSLPLIYNPSLELYTWDVTHPSLSPLLTSLSTLQFTFTNSSNISVTVDIPLALLNLTLTPPLVTTPTPYFPCRPFSPSDSQYYLGRAFLQGAFIGQSWDTGKTFLAQAPGPSLPKSQIVIISPDDTYIDTAEHAPPWQDTWTGVLSKDGIELTANVNGSSTKSSAPASPKNPSAPAPSAPSSSTQSHLKVGATAGISVSCVIIGLAAILGTMKLIHKKKRLNQRGDENRQDEAAGAWQKPELDGKACSEVADTVIVGERRELGGREILEIGEAGHIYEMGDNKSMVWR